MNTEKFIISIRFLKYFLYEQYENSYNLHIDGCAIA